MDFDDLKKVWDSQNNAPMYVINEAALHRRIRTRVKKAQRLSNMNEFGLMTICLGTFLLLIWISDPGIFSYLPGFAMLLIGGYVYWRRTERLEREKQFDQSMLGEIEQGLSNVRHEIVRNKTFIWWFIAPVAVPTIYNMYLNAVEGWQWALVLFSFVLSYFVVQLDLRYVQRPREKALLSLRDKFLEEVSPEDQ